MEIADLKKEFLYIAEEHGLMFAYRPVQGGMKLEKLIAKAFIAGSRKTRLELKGEADHVLPPDDALLANL